MSTAIPRGLVAAAVRRPGPGRPGDGRPAAGRPRPVRPATKARPVAPDPGPWPDDDPPEEEYA